VGIAADVVAVGVCVDQKSRPVVAQGGQHRIDGTGVAFEERVDHQDAVVPHRHADGASEGRNHARDLACDPLGREFVPAFGIAEHERTGQGKGEGERDQPLGEVLHRRPVEC
jgi:hypothetical protein